jgi:hypothetical protein
MAYTRQWLVDKLRYLGHPEAADAAERELPEQFSRHELTEFADRHGVTSRDMLIDELGGSP